MTWTQCVRKVPGIDYLFVDIKGNVYSQSEPSGKGDRAFRELSSGPNAKGYFQICISRNSKRKTLKTHRLVATAFHGPPTIQKPTCRHLDGDLTNNTPSNLCWGTSKENGADKQRHGTAKGTKNSQAKLTENAVREIRNLKDKQSTESVATKYKISPNTVYAIWTNRIWKHIE